MFPQPHALNLNPRNKVSLCLPVAHVRCSSCEIKLDIVKWPRSASVKVITWCRRGDTAGRNSRRVRRNVKHDEKDNSHSVISRASSGSVVSSRIVRVVVAVSHESSMEHHRYFTGGTPDEGEKYSWCVDRDPWSSRGSTGSTIPFHKMSALNKSRMYRNRIEVLKSFFRDADWLSRYPVAACFTILYFIVL